MKSKLIYLLPLLSPIVWRSSMGWPEFCLELLFILGIWLISRVPNSLKALLAIVVVVVFAYGTLMSGKLVSWPLIFHKEQLIFNSPIVRNGITKHQLDAVYVPYRIRLVIYNPLLNVNYFFKNLAGLFTVQRFYDVILLANIYPLALGIRNFINSKQTLAKGVILLCLLITLIAAGVNKSTDPFNSLTFATPILLYLIFAGLRQVNKKVYLFLLVVSFLILTTPSL